MQLAPLKQVFVSILLLNGDSLLTFSNAAQRENTALAKDQSREPSWGIPNLDST